MKKFDKVKVILSDCHLSAGRFFEGQLNPHEDFYFDDEMCELFEYFSSHEYREGPQGAVPVELILAGDYLDFLNVPVRGEFEDAITEDMAVYKIKAILAGHPKVVEALKRFASLPGKSITYLIGNHDADLFFPKVREAIIRAWDPQGQYPSDKVKIVFETDRLVYSEGVEIHHGNQMDPGNELDFKNPFDPIAGKQLLKLPWSSIYMLKIVNRLKWEREYIDKIRPVKVFVIYGLIFDTVFTLRFCFLSAYYFIKTRIGNLFRISGFKGALREILRPESRFFQDLEGAARKRLSEVKEVQTVIFGHTHRPMNKVYPDGKQYINTGTWTKMIDLDWRGLGQQFRRTFALIYILDGKARCELRQWVGESSPHKIFQG